MAAEDGLRYMWTARVGMMASVITLSVRFAFSHWGHLQLMPIDVRSPDLVNDVYGETLQ